MAGSLTDYCEELALNLLFRNTGELPPGTYLGLATSEILEDTLLTEIVEESDANYEREELLFTSPTQIGEIAVIKNSNKLVFGPWSLDATGAITHAFICDVQSGIEGELLAYFKLPNIRMPSAGETLTILVDDCILKIG
jgi:hypothetical protein